MKKTYVVTGGAGFIGSYLSKRLMNAGHRVFIFDDLSTGLLKNVPRGAIFYKIDISNTKDLFKIRIPEKISCIFHLAAQPSGEASFDNPDRDINVNYKATYNMLSYTRLQKCSRFIFSSSMSVYGEIPETQRFVAEDHPCRPVSFYGCNKLASEMLISLFSRNSGIKYTIFRLFNVYGPGQNMANLKQGMVSIYLAYLIDDLPIHVKGSLDRYRDFVYIDDVIKALIDSECCKNTYNNIYNVGTSRRTTVKKLLSIILDIYGKDDFKKWINVKGSTAGDILGCVADNRKLRNATGWEPKHSLKQGITRMKEWLDENAVLDRKS